MPEVENQIFFSHKAIVEEMIKLQGLHEGHWMMTVELGLRGTNLPVKEAGGLQTLTPSALVYIFRIGITQTKEPNDLSVDAAEVNPLKKAAAKSSKRSRKRVRSS
jgi:hypothetical protein